MTMKPRSQNHLAELLGISRSSCSALASRGMPTDSLEAAQAWRERNLDPARRKDGTRSDEPIREPNPSDEQPESFDQARTRDKIAEANLREMAAAKRRGELIEIAVVVAQLGKDYATTRDTLLQIPARMAALLAAESDPAVVQVMLHAEIHQALVQLSGTSDAIQDIADRGDE